MRRLRLKSLKRRDYSMLISGVIIALLGALFVSIINNSQTPLKPESPLVTIQWLPPGVKRQISLIEENAKKYNIDPNLVAIVMTMESGGWTKAKSEAGAEGLMQVTPPTAKDIASKYLKKPVTRYNLMTPSTSIEFGTAYLAFLRDYFGGIDRGPDSISLVELIGAGYNGGPGTAQALTDGEGLRDTQTVIYSRDIFNMWRERHSNSSPTFDRWKERGGSTLIDKANSQ